MKRHLDFLEKVILGLIVVNGGLGTAVGVDKASYYWRRRQSRPDASSP